MPIHKKYDPNKFNLKPLILNLTFILLFCCEILISRTSCFFLGGEGGGGHVILFANKIY